MGKFAESLFLVDVAFSGKERTKHLSPLHLNRLEALPTASLNRGNFPSTLCDHDVEPMTPCKRHEDRIVARALCWRAALEPAREPRRRKGFGSKRNRCKKLPVARSSLVEAIALRLEAIATWSKKLLVPKGTRVVSVRVRSSQEQGRYYDVGGVFEGKSIM